MAVKWMDNFEGYETPLNGNLNGNALPFPSGFLQRNYQITGGFANVGSASQFPRITTGVSTVPEDRPCLYAPRNLQAQSINDWQISRPLRNVISGDTTVYVGHKIVGLLSSSADGYNTANMGVAWVDPVGGTEASLILGIYIVSRALIRVVYADSDGTCQHVSISLSVPMSGQYDTIEYAFRKRSEILGDYTNFTMWVNNRIAYSSDIFNNVGSIEGLHWMVMGNKRVVAQGGSVPEGYVSLANNNYLTMGYGITDFYISNNKEGVNVGRMGKVRVTSRMPNADAGPNQFTRSAGAVDIPSNAGVVALIPPDTNRYLYGVGAGDQDMYGAAPFPALGSEAVKAVMVRFVGSKNDPTGFDLSSVLRLGEDEYEQPLTPLATEPTYSNAVLNLNPATNLPWTPTEANNTQFGVKLVGA